MFRRRKQRGLEDYAGVRPEDLKVLAALVAHGATLSEPRHVLHFLYLPDEAAARAAAAEAPEWTSTVSAPADGYRNWSLVLEREGYRLTPDNVRRCAEEFSELAATYSGRYDGWEASV